MSTPRDREIRRWLKALAPGHWAYLVETEASEELYQVRALIKWQEEVPVRFQEEEVRLTERVFPLKMEREQTEKQPSAKTQEKGPVLVGADSQEASAPPLSFYTDMS